MYGNDVIFDIDLNAVRDYNRITVLLRKAKGFVPNLQGGDWVQLRDEDGALWAGLIEKIDDGGRVRLKIDWSLRTEPAKPLPAPPAVVAFAPASPSGEWRS